MMLRTSFAFAERRRRFVSAVTHELRTPLTTFRMYSEMLADGMVKDPEVRQSYLETLKSESERLTAIVENVLTYARLEEGKTAVASRQLAVDELLDAVLDPLQRRAEACGGTITVLSGQAPGSLPVDAAAVGQILFNLVDNACKYAGGESGPAIRLQLRREPERLVLEVQDDGPGVSAADAPRIFEPFERGAEEPGDGSSGVGLGLALSRDLARSLGGDLSLVNGTGAGACFRLVLPGLRHASAHAVEVPAS
jgi:signal transduction histidine kinase